MKFSVVIPNPSAGEGFDRPDTVMRVARAVEAAGLHACGSPDHPFPLVRDGRAGHHTWDPFVVLTWVAAATSSVLLHTNVIVLPVNLHPANPDEMFDRIAALGELSVG